MHIRTCFRLLLLASVTLALSSQASAQETRATANGYRLLEIKSDTLPSLNIARAGHALLCVDGVLTVFGGHTSGFIPTSTAEYFHDGKWHTVPLVYPHDHAAVCRLRSGKVFLAGGHKEPLGIGNIFAAELYDPDLHECKGFGCMDKKRAFANAAEMADGKVVISGNWYSGDGIEIFEDVFNPAKPNAVEEKISSVARSNPYILRISDDDAIIFSSSDNEGNPANSSVVDRLQRESYHEPFLDKWRPLHSIIVQRSAANLFVGDESRGCYEWLLPVVSVETGEVAIARVTGISKPDSTPVFSLLETQQPLPDNIGGKPIVYSSLLCDRNRKIAYLIGDFEESRIVVVAIPFDAPDTASVMVYVTDPQPMVAHCGSPVLTDDGNIVFAGGYLHNNFAPTDSVILLPLGKTNESVASTQREQSEFSGYFRWLWIVVAIIIMSIVLWLFIMRRRKHQASKQIVAMVDSSEQTAESEDISEQVAVSDDTSAIKLFKQIEKLMEEEQLFLNPNLRASDVAAAVGSNTAYVSAAVNSQRRCSFSQFLTAYRISFAQEIMRRNPEIKVSTVSVQSGFSTDSTFFRAFRSSTGMSPKEWLASLSVDKEKKIPNK